MPVRRNSNQREEKVNAILEMPHPEDKRGVLRVLGIMNFIGKFIPNLSSKTLHLRQLLHDDIMKMGGNN